MAVLATNLVPRPFFNEDIETDAWRISGGGQAPVKGRDVKGNPFFGLQVGAGKSGAVPSNAPHTLLGTFPNGTVLHVEATIKQVTGTATKVILGVVPTLTTGNSAAANFFEQLVTRSAVTYTGTVTAQTTGDQFLRIGALGTEAMDCTEVRVYAAEESDEYGIFDGNTPDTDTLVYEWTGDPEMSASTVSDVGTDPEPEPVTHSAIARRVAKFLGQADNETILEQAEHHAEIITDYVWGYTRGKGFKPGADEDEVFIDELPARPLRSVIVAATARLANNPEQVTYFVTGDYSERPAVMSGWMLHELQVMNNYRRRWA